MRITVKTVLEYLTVGDTIKDILEAYPFLEQEDIFACLYFIAQIVDNEPIT